MMIQKHVLVLGGTGGLGHKLVAWLTDKVASVRAVGKADFDVTDHYACVQFFDRFNFDVVVNLSGVNHNALLHKKAFAHFHEMIDTNVKGTVNVVSACLQRMRLKGYGRIILVSSTLSNRVVKGTAVYSAGKAFIDKFVQNITAENIDRGITANSIQLGYFDAGMTYTIPQEKRVKIQEDTIGLKRFGTIEELGKTIEFLVNNEYVAGANIQVDGFIK